jgi:hypothetical protein
MKMIAELTMIVVCSCVFVLGCELNQGVDFMVMQKTPASSAVAEGRGLSAEMNLGWFDEPFLNPNVVDAVWFPPTTPGGDHIRQKKWHFFSFASDRYIIGLAAVDATYIANGFVYVYDFDSGAFKEFSNVGGSSTVTISENSVSGESTYDAPGFWIHIVNNGVQHTVDFLCDDGTDTLSGTLHATEVGDPFVQAKEVFWRHIVYTHQNSMGRASGTATWNGQAISFDSATDFAGMDYTAGIQKYETFWNWASGTGTATDGTPLAVNLGGDALFWIDTSIHRVEGVTFTYDNLLSDWTIRSEDGVIDLTFQPVFMREGLINIFNIIVSEFYQPFGSFTGTLTGADETVYEIDTMLGVTEEHFAKW